MLVLTRRVGERVMIDTGISVIEVTVLDFRGSRIRLGFEAPESYQVDREEIARRRLQGKEAKDGRIVVGSPDPNSGCER